MSTTVTISPELQQLSEQVSSLAERVSRLEGSDALAIPEDLEKLTETHERVKQFTERIFGGQALVEPSSDPETDAQYFVVQIGTLAEVEEALRLDSDWHRRLPEAAEEWSHLYRLSVNFP